MTYRSFKALLLSAYLGAAALWLLLAAPAQCHAPGRCVNGYNPLNSPWVGVFCFLVASTVTVVTAGMLGVEWPKRIRVPEARINRG